MEPININPIISDLPLSLGSKPAGVNEEEKTRFGALLKDAISTVNDLSQQSDLEIRKIMTGESDELHTAVVAMQRADLSFQMMMQVRNKILQAYQEVLRMPV
ncbi:MAG: flagellar hook-basal body complex protein FliE [Acidobacteriota bacterium]|jgi:flagellar hook-basal body complex protein FliE|nr:flagellar hook-basal body complex protein FliE [Acidobacteriota bacterium]